MKKKSNPASASHTRLPKGHKAFNLPQPAGGDFQGAQLNSPMPSGAPQLPGPQAPGMEQGAM